MVLLVALAAAIAAIAVCGGRLSLLASLQWRWWGLVVAALVLQVLVISVLDATLPSSLEDGLHLCSYALAATFVIRNLAVPGLWMVGLGGASNLVAVASNGGVMPASAAAMRTAGRALPVGHFTNSTTLAHPHLLVLGDVLAVPRSVPLANVFSVGDVTLVAGAALLVSWACLPLRPARAGRGAALPGASG